MRRVVGAAMVATPFVALFAAIVCGIVSLSRLNGRTSRSGSTSNRRLLHTWPLWHASHSASFFLCALTLCVSENLRPSPSTATM